MKAKISNFLGMFLTVVFLTSAIQLFAQGNNEEQRGKGMGKCFNIPDLTADQQKKIEDLSVPHQKDMLKFRNQLTEKHARLQTLRTTDPVDMNAINKTIDEISQIKGDMMKKKEAHHQEVRKLLTDKQKVWFDSHEPEQGKGHRKGQGRNCGNEDHGPRGMHQGKCDGTGPKK